MKKKPLFFLLCPGASLQVRRASDSCSGHCSPGTRQEGAGGGGDGEESLCSTDPLGFIWVGKREKHKLELLKEIAPT